MKLICFSFPGLDDLCARFIINLPVEELGQAARILFQIEEAQWFYEDFVRPLDPSFPHLNLRAFTQQMFQHCPMLCEWPLEDQQRAYDDFVAYKTTVPVRGAIMLNDAMDEVVLVKGWKSSASWSFPRGKLNEEESDLTCALREVYEETGYDLENAGLAEGATEADAFEQNIKGQNLKMYAFRGVPMDTNFAARTRKEISGIEWHKVSDLAPSKTKKDQQQQQGNKYYMVAPFLHRLRKWIATKRKEDKAKGIDRIRAITPIQKITTEEKTVLAGMLIDEQSDTSQEDPKSFDRLVDTLRQSNQATVNDLPEVSAREPDKPQSADLLALLRNGTSLPERRMSSTPTSQDNGEGKNPCSLSYHPSSEPASDRLSSSNPTASVTSSFDLNCEAVKKSLSNDIAIAAFKGTSRLTTGATGATLSLRRVSASIYKAGHSNIDPVSTLFQRL